jgi:hypothetical protein
MYRYSMLMPTSPLPIVGQREVGEVDGSSVTRGNLSA